MADFYTELDNLREIASENKEEALKKAKKMIDKVSDFNECSNLASIIGDNDYLNNKDIARELFEKCLEFDVDDALDIARTGSIIANQDLDLLGDVDLAKKFFEKAYKVATEDQDWMNIASSMTDSLNEIFILEAKKIYIKIAENSDDIGCVCDSIEAIFDPERFNDSELAHRELKKYLSKAQSLDDLQKLVSTSVFCEDNELALNFFKEAIGKVNNSDDENEILGIVDNVVLGLNTKLFIGVDLSPISCPSENKNFVLEIIKNKFTNIDDFVEIPGGIKSSYGTSVFEDLATEAIWCGAKKLAVEIIQEAESRLTDAYDANELADFVEQEGPFGINDKEWGEILRNKANEL